MSPLSPLQVSGSGGRSIWTPALRLSVAHAFVCVHVSVCEYMHGCACGAHECVHMCLQITAHVDDTGAL